MRIQFYNNDLQTLNNLPLVANEGQLNPHLLVCNEGCTALHL
jgi:hypothetical protein